MVSRLEAEGRDLAPPPDLDVLRVVSADRRVRVGDVGDLQELLAQPPLDLGELRLSLGDAVLHRPRLGYEPLAGLGVLFPADALRHLVLLLPELVELPNESRAPVRQLDYQSHVRLDAAGPGVLLHDRGVLADVSEIEHGGSLRSPASGIRLQLGAN